MAPAQIPVFLSQKPSTENGQFRVAELRLAWTRAKLQTKAFQRCHRGVNCIVSHPGAEFRLQKMLQLTDLKGMRAACVITCSCAS